MRSYFPAITEVATEATNPSGSARQNGFVDDCKYEISQIHQIGIATLSLAISGDQLPVECLYVVNLQARESLRVHQEATSSMHLD